MYKAPPYFETRKLSTLKAHPDNVRTVADGTPLLLWKSIQAFGLLRPLVLNLATGNVIDGDRILEALRVGMTHADAEVPVWCVNLPESFEDAAHLALNNHAGEWRWQAVSEQLKAIQANGLDPVLTGFLDSDVGPLTAADWAPAEKGPLDGSDPAQGSFL